MVIEIVGGFKPFKKYYSKWVLSINCGEGLKECFKPTPSEL